MTASQSNYFDSPTALYGYVPNLPANIVGAVLYFVITVFQVLEGLATKDWWMLVTWGITGGLEITCYIARSISHHKPKALPMYEMQLICSIIGPAFMAAGLYYQLGKQITIYGEHYSPIKPMIYTAVFTTSDVISLVIQGVGGGIAAGDLGTPEGPNTGGWIMVGGIAFQVFVLGLFAISWIWINWRIYRDDPSNYDPKFASNRARPLFKFLFPAVSLSLVFLMLRSIYRIIELSVGWSGYLMDTERYFLILDGLMIVLGMIPLTIVYPGFAYGYVPVRGLNYKDKKKPEYLEKDPDYYQSAYSNEGYSEPSFEEPYVPNQTGNHPSA